MATQKDKRSSLLNFDRGEKWVAPAEIARQKEEEQRAALEKERRNAPVDWSNVKTGSDTFVKPQEEPSGFANLINQIVRPTTDYVGDMGTMAKADIKAGLGARMFTHDDIGDGAGAEVGRSLYDSLNIQGGGPISSLLQTLSGNREDTGELGKRLYQEANATKSEVNKEYKDSNWAAQGGVDLAGSPLSALSVIGGPTAFITGEDVFNKTYTESRLAEASKGASAARAGAMAAIETGVSAIPAGKLLEKIPYVKKLVPREGLIKVMGDAQQFAVKTGLTMAGESAEEVTTTLAQLGLDKLISEHAEDPGIRKVAEANLPKNTVEFWDSIRRTAVAGAGGGLAMGSPIEAMNIMRESGAAASQMLTNLDATNKDQIKTPVLADAPRSAAIQPTAAPAPVQNDMFGTPEGLPSVSEFEQTRQAGFEDEAIKKQQMDQMFAQNEQSDEERLRLGTMDLKAEGGAASGNIMADAIKRAGVNRLAAATKQTATPEQAPAPVTRTAEQPDLFQMQEQNELAQQKAAALKTREGATKIVKKDDAAIKASAAQKRAAEKREHLKGVVEATRGLPEAERVDAIANASQDWDLNNPQEKYVQAAVKAATSTPAAKKSKAKKPVATVADEIDGLLSGLAKGDENSNPTTGVKVADVARSLVSTFGQGNTKKLAKLINDRNLEVVADVSQIPEGAAPAGAHGFYDGNRMYVVANRLDPNNIVGGMLEIVAHEVKHAADISGKVTMGEFVGKKANASLNAQIRQAAARGDVAAQRAMEAAKAGSNSAAEFALELPAYYINESRDTRGASRTAILRDALSAVRTTAKRIMPGTYEVSLSDVAYLSDKLITEAAVQGKKLDGDINGGLAMIYDKTATGFDKAKAESRTYTSADGTEKFVLSDSEAKLHPEAHKRLTRRSSRVTKLSDILEHDVLFEQHPEAKDIEIYVASEAEMGDSFGLYLPTDIVSNGFITIRKDVAEGTNQGNSLREALMHEVQHWVQDRSARRDNFFDKNKLPKPEGYEAWQAEYKESRRANDKANRRFLDNAKLIRELVMPGAVKNVDRVLFDKNLEDHQKVREILDYLEDADALDDPRIESLAAGVASTKVAHNEAAKKVNDGLDDYFKNLTEREAFYTQDTIDTPQDKLPVNPEADMRVDSPDKTLRDQVGRTLPLAKGEKPATAPASGPVSQIVKHGTPHSFQPEEGHRIGKFRDDKMGTGEGAQAFGWGHYLTEMWETADGTYRQRLLDRQKPRGNSPGSWQPNIMDNLMMELAIELYGLDFWEIGSWKGKASGVNPHTGLSEDIFSDKSFEQFRNILQHEIDEAASGKAAKDRLKGVIDFLDLDNSDVSAGTEDFRKTYVEDLISMYGQDWKPGYLASAQREADEIAQSRAKLLEVLDNTTPDQLNKAFNQSKKDQEDKTAKSEGEVYYVDIPEDDQLMDWDGEVEDDPRLQDIIKEAGLTSELSAALLNGELGELLDSYNENLQEDLTYLEDEFRNDDDAASVRKLALSINTRLSKLHALHHGDYREVGFKDNVLKELDTLEHNIRYLRKFTSESTSVGDQIQRELNNLHGGIWNLQALVEGQGNLQTAQDVYSALENKFNSDKEASKYLHKRGILGHYFQPPSRNQKTRNFVIYDEGSLKIVGRDAREKGLGRPETKDLREKAKERAAAAERASASKRAQFEREARERVQTGEGSKGLAFVPRNRKTAAKVDNAKRLSKRVLLPGGGFEAALEEAGLHSKSLPAGMSVKATSLGQTLKDNIDKVASSLDIPVKELNDTLDKKLEEINKLETKDARDSAINALDRTYPGVGTALRAIRDFKWEMTLDLIHMRKRDSDRPLTKKELNTYKSMIKNAETYTTRAYLATYNRDIGAEYAESLMSHYDQDPTSEEGKKVAVAIKYLVDNTLLIPDEATMLEMSTKQVRRLHDNWLTPSDKLKGIAGKKAMIKALLKLDPHTQQEMEEKALEIVRDMLGLNEVKGSVAASYAFSKGAKQNRTILESRTDLPVELRQMMGEITDPVLREAITMHRMIQLTAKTKLLTEIMEKGKDKGWWSDARTSENKTKLDDIAYGPMNGKWINDDVKDMLTGRLLSLRTDDQKIADAIHNPTLMSEILAGRGVRATQALSRIQKTATIVMDVSQMGLNFVGAFSNVALNGFPVTHMLKGMQVAAIAGAGDVSIKLVPKELLGILEEATTAGALDSATVGDLKGQASEAITSAVQALTDAQRSNPATVFHTAVRAAKKHGSTTLVAFRQAYAFMDVWVKVATYLSNKEFYTKFNEAEGKGWTAEDIQRRSGYEASGTNISYERAIPLFKVLEKSSPFHMFATYFSEVFRSVGMSYVQSYRDFKLASEATTPEGRNMAMLKGTQRLTGTLLATAGLIAYTMSKLNAEDDDERKRRNLVDPEWNRDKIPFVIGKDKDGNDVVWYMNIMDPNGPLNDPIISILNAKAEDKPRVAMKAVLDLMVPSKGVLSVGKILWDATIHSAAAVSGNDRLLELDTKTNKNTVTQANYPKTYTAIKRMLSAGDIGVNAVQAFESLFMVGTVKPWIDDRGNVVKEAGTGRKAVAETGLSVTTRDPDKALKYKVYDYQDKIKKLGEERKELLKDAQYMDSTDMMEALTGVLKEERKAFDTLRGHYEGYMTFEGKNASTATAAFGTQGKKLAGKIRANNFTSSVVTMKSLNDWYKTQNKDPKVDKKELAEEYKLLKSAYEGAMNGKD